LKKGRRPAPGNAVSRVDSADFSLGSATFEARIGALPAAVFPSELTQRER
jgi:hypothetical protein